MGVREVSLLADTQEPDRVSQRAYDAARAKSKRFASSPRAVHVAVRLDLSWREVLGIAHEPPNIHAQRLSRKHGQQQDWLTREYVASLLSLVAHKLDGESVTPNQYRAVRDELLAEDSKHWRHGRKLLLPTEDQIRIAVGVWDQALELAGLPTRTQHKNYGVTVEELLDRCYEVHQTQPTEAELRRFARANGIPYKTRRGRTWGDCIHAWKQQRHERGQAVPERLPPLRQRPDYSRLVGAARPGERRLRSWTNIEDCIECVIAYLAELGDTRSSKRGYQAWAAARRDAPSYSAFDQHGGWGRIRTLALERL